MKIKIQIYRNWTGAWTPTTEEWHRNRQLLHPLCISGNIGFRKREHIVELFSDNGIEAVEETDNNDGNTSEQLMLF